MRHHWWHDAIAGSYYAVATDEAGRIVSAWMHDAGPRWLALETSSRCGWPMSAARSTETTPRAAGPMSCRTLWGRCNERARGGSLA